AACHPAGGEAAEEGAVRSEAIKPAMAGADTVWGTATTRGGVYGRRSTDHQRVFVKACEAVQSQAHPGHSRLPQAPEVHRLVLRAVEPEAHAGWPPAVQLQHHRHRHR